MRLGIMQPYFFPYLGHFALIAHCDRWVVFDITQYTPKSYMSRNVVLKASGGQQRIFAELSNGSIHIKTWQAELANPQATHKQPLGSLSHYKRHAPYYWDVVKLVNQTFEALANSPQPNSLVKLNTLGLGHVCQYLGIAFNAIVASQHPWELPAHMGPGDWAPLMAHQLGASHYMNPVGGQALFNPAQFEALGVGLEFLKTEPMLYKTRGVEFEPNLSILDVLMWNTAEQVRAHLSSASEVLKVSPQPVSCH